MTRLFPLAALVLVAACDPALMPGTEPPEPEVVTLPPQVAAVLPPGTPPTTVFLDEGTGCYLFSVELTDPPSGYYVRDNAGNPICEGDGQPAAVVGDAGTPEGATG